MNRYRMSTILPLLLILSGCYFPMSGRVIDAETHQPIEGAVVLVEWTKTHGFGEYWTESYKVFETLSDKEGKVNLPGCYSPFVNAPDVTVYKKGYVAWNNKLIFPHYKRRATPVWGSAMTFNLERFLTRYTYIDHRLFVSGAAHLGMADEKKKLFETYYDEGESSKVQEELRQQK